MRVFHFIDTLNTGGSEHQMVELVRRQLAFHDIIVGCLSAHGRYRIELDKLGIPIVEFSPKGSLTSLKGLSALWDLRRFLKDKRIDVFHSHDLYSTLMGVPAAWLARVRRIVSCRRDLGSWWWYTPLNRKVLHNIQKLSHVVIANSKGVRDHLIENDGFSPNHIRVVLNGVDCEDLSNRPSRGELLPGAQISDFLVIQVANMHGDTKGHAYLIEAAEEVCKEAPDVKFLLIGDGKLRPILERDIETKGLSSRFFFLGSRKDVKQVLACCDVGVLASLAEGLPNSVLEYAAAGLPVVATRVGGIPEIIEDNISGFIVPPRDAHSLAESILKLERNRVLAFEMGKKGREQVRTRFSYERLLAEVEDVYSPPAKNL